MIVLIFGALLYAMIFGNVTTIISQIYADMNRYHDSLNSVREFARFNSVPQNIEARIIIYLSAGVSFLSLASLSHFVKVTVLAVCC